MFTAVTSLLTLLAAAVIYVRADPDPNNPGPGDILIEGKPCPIGWNVDPTGVWKTMNIDLMTGDNFNMVYLETIATVDGTNPSKNNFSFTCPQVTPHSPIYFYQFSSPASLNKTWTGRFTITDSAKNIVAPDKTTQPDGQKIPWGIGSLVAASSASSETSVVTANTSSTLTPESPLMSTSSLDTTVPTSSLNTTVPTSSVVSLTSKVSTTPSGVSTTGANGAGATLSVSNIVFQSGLALGLAAFGFTLMF